MASLEDMKKLWHKCHAVKTSFIIATIRYFYFKTRGKNLLISNRVSIYGLKNITTIGLLKVGLDYVGFMDHHDRTLLRVNGKMRVAGNFSIAKGCRLEIGGSAVVDLDSGYINADTRFVIRHSLKIGSGCAISWGCLFLDDDLHHLSYPGKRERPERGIVIGDHVWIGSNVTVLKGARIPNGCVVASGSVVKSAFTEENILLAGNPARPVHRDVVWT